MEIARISIYQEKEEFDDIKGVISPRFLCRLTAVMEFM
jgi:hypothetical protein